MNAEANLFPIEDLQQNVDVTQFLDHKRVKLKNRKSESFLNVPQKMCPHRSEPTFQTKDKMKKPPYIGTLDAIKRICAKRAQPKRARAPPPN